MARGDKADTGFEPPAYIASLIGAVNDGAKAAQGGALLVMFVGIYLLATAFSASDEDLLLGKVMTISQIGAALPVTVSFAIAPVVFVFLHIYTLVRFDMLAANVRHLSRKLRDEVQVASEREDCLQLLGNVEFVLALAAPEGSRLHSRLWPWMFRGIIAAFPVLMLLLVQINALRYQSDLITWTQRLWIAIDLAALVWFFRRNTLNGTAWPTGRLASAGRWLGLAALPIAVMALDLAYLNIAPADADPKQVRYAQYPFEPPPQPYFSSGGSSSTWGDENRFVDYLVTLAGQPLDAGLCPWLHWGCRYLRVEHRTLVDKVWDNKAVSAFRLESTVPRDALANIEGLVLRDRSFRFAVLDDSRLYAADLTGADLTGASLVGTNLSAARAIAAQLPRADLNGATLQDANLFGANLRGALLFNARLDGANLGVANLEGVLLDGASLRGADLQEANLDHAIAYSVQLQGAYLREASLRSARLGAQMQGADLRGASLQDADLTETGLEGAILRGADLSGVKSSTSVRLDLADLRGSKGHPLNLDFSASPQAPIWVSDPKAIPFAQHSDWLVENKADKIAAHRNAAIAFRIDEVAVADPRIAAAMAKRAASDFSYAPENASTADRSVDRIEASLTLCKLVKESRSGHLKLDRLVVDGVTQALNKANIPCLKAPDTAAPRP